MKRAIVVGAGLGGLATAVRLQHQGFQTVVLEKNQHVGGRCDRWQAEGFTFDTGPSILLMVDALRELFSSVGREVEDYLTLVRLPFNYRIRFGDGSRLDLSSDQQAVCHQLDAIEPGAGAAYLRFMEDAGRKYHVARARFVDRNFYGWGEFLTPGNLLAMLRIQALTKLEGHVRHYFADPRLQLAFTFQTMYLGLAPSAAPAIYAMLPYTELVHGIWYPMGGMYEIPLALARLLEEFGGEIRTGALVEEIVVRGDRVAGVRLAEGSDLAADVVVCNADLPYSYRTLVPERYRAPYRHGRLERLRHGCSAFMLYLGVDQRYEQLFHHNVYLSRDPADNFADIFQRFRLPSDPSFYVHCGARTDPGVAPPGRDALFILVPVPHLHSGIDWATEAPRYRELILDRLEAVAAPEVRRHIVAERMVTPVEWAAQYNLYHGATFGLSHDFFQVGYMRPRNKASALEGLYFAGASTVPGGGVPMVLISSRLVAQRVQREVVHA